MHAVLHYLRFRLKLLPIFEGLVMLQVMISGLALSANAEAMAGAALPLSLGFTALMLLGFTAGSLYDARRPTETGRIAIRFAAAYCAAIVVLAAVSLALPDLGGLDRPFLLTTLAATLITFLLRLASARSSLFQLPPRRVIVVGDGPEAHEVARILHNQKDRRSAREVSTFSVNAHPQRHRAEADASMAARTAGGAAISVAAPVAGAVAASGTGVSAGSTAGSSASAGSTGKSGAAPEAAAGAAAGARQAHPGSLAAMIAREMPEEIVVAVRERRGGNLPQRELLRAKVSGIRVTGLLSFYERELGLVKLQHLLSGWIIYGPGFDQGRLRSIIKRCFDLGVSSLLLLLAAPVMVLVALAVRLESPGPAFFRQTRVRDGGNTFEILKFRSMRNDAEKEGRPVWASVGDPRITRVGNVIRKLRIDELPQLINVLRGEMSFVGPRPERPFFVDQLVERCPFYDIRHSIRPGLTGWAQVRLPYGASIDDAMSKLEFDLYYVKHHSLFLDVMILFETIRVVLNKAGAR